MNAHRWYPFYDIAFARVTVNAPYGAVLTAVLGCLCALSGLHFEYKLAGPRPCITEATTKARAGQAICLA